MSSNNHRASHRESSSFDSRDGSSGSGVLRQNSSQALPQGNSASSQRTGKGDKRGRDRSAEPGSSKQPDKKRNPVPQREALVGANRKKRDEFPDQINTRQIEVKKVEEKNCAYIPLRANFFKVSLSSMERISITSYRVDFEPETEIMGLRNALLFQHKAKLGRYVYDGNNLLFSARSFPNVIALKSKSKEGQEYTLTLKNTGIILCTDGRFLQVLNLIIHEAKKSSGLMFVGRNFYDLEKGMKEIRFGNNILQICSGILTSIRQHEQHVLLGCEVVHRVMPNPKENVLHIIEKCLRICQQSGGSYKDAAANRIVGSVVITRYNNKTYRIDDIAWDMDPSQKFMTKKGEITFAAYYEERYLNDEGKPLRVSQMGQPLLVVNASARDKRAGRTDGIVLVPEFCYMTGISDEMRSDRSLMVEMSSKTRLSPAERVSRISEFIKRLQKPESQQVLKENLMTISPEMVHVTGRQLMPKSIQFKNKSSQPDYDWTNSLKSNVMYKEMMTTMGNWSFVYPREYRSNAQTFMQKFLTKAETLCEGSIRKPEYEELDGALAYDKKLEDISRKDPSIIMVVLPTNKLELFSRIKKVTLCRSKPVPTQVILHRTLTHKYLDSIMTKVAIQVNCKLGGIPWMCKMPFNGIMVVGFEVSNSNKKQSYGAMVASLNPENLGGHFFSTVCESSQQLSANFGTNIVAALSQYMRIEKALPEGILIYRGGVGDGDIEHVVQQELEDVKKRVNYFYKNADPPKIGFVIVNKRTNTRLFATDKSSYTNPPIGTVVDDVITLPERYDFYLISQSMRQGTVSPTYYNVIYDKLLPNNPRIMQYTTFMFCHLYYNWSGTVGVPSVVQYAKKLAILAGHMNSIPNLISDKNKQLYFL